MLLMPLLKSLILHIKYPLPKLLILLSTTTQLPYYTLKMQPIIHNLRIFASGPDGGNPLPVVISEPFISLTESDMQSIAVTSGHESGFVFPAHAGSDCDFEFRFWYQLFYM